MILGDNPAVPCFVLRDLVLIELFQRSHICVTECMLLANFLLKIVKKEITFSPICEISQYVIFLSNRRGKFKLLGLQRNPRPQFPRLVGHPDLPMRKILKVIGLFAVMIFFQSKKFTICKVKACVHYFLRNFYFSPNNIPSKTVNDIFTSFKKLLSFSRYSNFCISFFPSFSPCQTLLESLIQDKSSSL